MQVRLTNPPCGFSNLSNRHVSKQHLYADWTLFWTAGLYCNLDIFIWVKCPVFKFNMLKKSNIFSVSPNLPRFLVSLVSLKGTITPPPCLHVAYPSHLWPLSLTPDLRGSVVKSNYFFFHKTSYICSHYQYPSSDLGYLFCELFCWVSNHSYWL